MTDVPPLEIVKNLPPLHDSTNINKGNHTEKQHHKKHIKHHAKHNTKHTKHAKHHAKDHNKAHHGHHSKKHRHSKNHSKKPFQKTPSPAPSPPKQRRLSATFQPVSWSDFAAVESRLTAEALQYVNDPKRLKQLRQESMDATKKYIQSESLWSLEEDKTLLRSRGFELQEEYDIVQQKIQSLPTKKLRSFESMADRVHILLATDTAAESGDKYVPSTNAMQNERAHVAFRGKLVMQDLMSEFLQKGTGYALNQGVKEENMLGVPLALRRNAAAKKTEMDSMSGGFSDNGHGTGGGGGTNNPNKAKTGPKKIHPDLLKAPATPHNDLSILVKEGMGGHGQTVSGNSEILKKSSPLIRAYMNNKSNKVVQLLNMLDIQPTPDDPCICYETNPKTMHLNGAAKEFKDVHTHDMISKKTVEKYILFASDSKMMERSDHLASIKSLRLKHSQQLRTFTFEQVELERNKMKMNVRLHQEQEKNELREYLNEQMKAEIDAVVARHEQIRIAEDNHLMQRQQDQIEMIDGYFHAQKEKVQQMGTPPDELPAIRLQREQQMEHVEQALSNVFDGSDVIVLMLLGSYLHCADLVAGCIRSLAEHRPEPEWLPQGSGSKTSTVNKKAPPLLEYLDCPGQLSKCFDSVLVDDAMCVRLVQRLSTRALMALETKDSSHTGAKLMARIQRELKTRKIMSKESYQTLTSNQLKQLKIQTDIFLNNLSKSNGNFFQDELFGGSGGSSGSSGSSDGAEPSEPLVLKDMNGDVVCDWHTPPFVDLVENEIIRRKKISNVCFNSTTLPSTLSLSYDRMRLTLETSHRYASAQSTVARSSTEFGKWMFEIEIVVLPNVGCSVSIGFDVPLNATSWVPPTHTNNIPLSPRGKIEVVGQIGGRGVALPGHSRDDAGRCGYAWEGDGKGRPEPGSPSKAHSRSSSSSSSSSDSAFGAYHMAGRTFTAPNTFCQGDVIGVCLDQDHSVPRIMFYKNGRKVRLGNECESFLRDLARSNAWKERRKHIDIGARLTSGDIPIVNADYKLVPAVCLFSSNKLTSRAVKPCVRANFKGPFRFPLHLHGLEFVPFGGNE